MFEVVFDPSPDKPKKRIPGPAPSYPTPKEHRSAARSATPTSRSQAHSFYRSQQAPSISSYLGRRYHRSCGDARLRPSRPNELGGLSVRVSSVGRAVTPPRAGAFSPHILIPLRKRLRSRHSNLRRHHHTIRRRKVRQRINLLSPPHAQHGPTHKEQRQIRSHFRRDPQPVRRRKCLPEPHAPTPAMSPPHLPKRPHPSLHRQPLFDLDYNPALRTQAPSWLVQRSGSRYSTHPAAPADPRSESRSRSPRHTHPDHIMQSDGLIHRQEFMESVLPRRPNAQPKIDFRERSHGDWHGPMIVKSKSSFDEPALFET